MELIAGIVDWIRDNETLLSGVAAAIVIAGVATALLSRIGSASAGVLAASGRRASSESSDAPSANDATPQLAPELRYCRSSDGVKLAFSSVGDGPPLVRALGWFTHIDLEWQNETSRYFWERLAAGQQVWRYDARGMGLSERNIDSITADTRLLDLEAVVDAAGLERFALMGFSEGGTTAVRYAAKHPERVSHLVLWGTYLRHPPLEQLKPIIALVEQIPEHWGGDSPIFHQMWAAQFLPDGGAEHNRLYRELQRASATPEAAYMAVRSLAGVDTRDDAQRVEAPTLVMHRRGDLVVTVDQARELAAGIPGARLMLLDGNNHWMWMHEHDTDEVLAAIHEFVAS